MNTEAALYITLLIIVENAWNSKNLQTIPREQAARHQAEEIFYVALEQNLSNIDVMRDGIKSTTDSGSTSVISTAGEEQITVDLPTNERKLTMQNKISYNGRVELVGLFTNILFLRHLLMTCLGTAAAFGICTFYQLWHFVPFTQLWRKSGERTSLSLP